MNQYKLTSAVLFTASMFFLATFSAWAEPEPGKQDAAATAAEEIVPADAIDTAEVAEVSGLDIPMDGSSLEAFEKNLEKVRETSSESDYNSIKAAFDYLLLYDLGSKGDPEKLAARLDGVTGREMLDRIKWSNSNK